MASQWPPKKNTAFTLYFSLYKSDGTIIANPDASITKKVSIDGAAVADITASVTEEDTTYGQLSVVLSSSEMNGDAIWVYIKDGTAGCVPFTCTLYTAGSLHDEMKADTAAILVDTGTTLDGRIPAALVSGRMDASVGAVASGAITAAALDATVQARLGIVAYGTAQAVTGTTIQLASASTFADDELLGAVVVITGGSTGVGQSRMITDYVSSTDTATVDTWTTTPTGTITYVVFAAAPASATSLPAVTVGTGGITSSSFAADAITTASIAQDAYDDIADAVWDEAMGAHVGGGSAGLYLANILADTDELQTDWVNGGRLDLLLDGAASAGDPWTTALPGAYGAGTAGKIVGDNLNAPVADVPTVAEFEARTLVAADYVVVGDTLAAVTTVGSVTGAVGSVTGAVGSVTGAVGSVTAGVTLANDAVSAAALSAAAIDEILDEQIGDGTITMRQALRVILAGMAGKLSGAATTSVTIRNLADSADVVVATVDADGNRSAVTVTP